ncbi:MAG: hypothetical protein AB1403_07700 [Candidatus Riflebacteria bacterium]
MPVIAISDTPLHTKLFQQLSFYWLMPAIFMPFIFMGARYFFLKAKIVMINSFHGISHEFLDEQIEIYRRISFAILAVQMLLLIFAIMILTRWPFHSIILCISTGIAQQLTRPGYDNWQSHLLEKRERHQDFFKH